ncbi:hypothetical protein CRG98_007346 [Punica granatum]|uniref:Uncharacterized protein n=1 Tax=Punica granatum TaxID=22663 RepID=A0A2I0KUY1_PUNGR|nr:hypothetical protein CRG98_007346 [Punica granatum]
MWTLVGTRIGRDLKSRGLRVSTFPWGRVMDTLSPWKVGRPSVHGSPCHGGRVKAACGLPAKVGTTHRSYGTW